MTARLLSPRFVLAAALLGGAATSLALACDPSSDASAPLVAGDAGRTVHVASKDDGGITSDSQVLDFLLADSDTEVARARMASGRATSDVVKEYASLMVTDHGAMADRLRELGRQKGITPVPSTQSQELLSDDEAIRDKLDGLKPASFDRNYLEEEIVEHLKAMATLERSIAAAARDPDVVKAVSDAHEAAIAHRERAQELLRAVRAEAGAPKPESTSSSDVKETSTADAGRRPDAGLHF